MAKRTGRPLRAGAPTVNVSVRVTVAERETWEVAANDRSLSDWIREACNAHAKGSR